MLGGWVTSSGCGARPAPSRVPRPDDPMGGYQQIRACPTCATGLPKNHAVERSRSDCGNGEATQYLDSRLYSSGTAGTDDSSDALTSNWKAGIVLPSSMECSVVTAATGTSLGALLGSAGLLGSSGGLVRLLAASGTVPLTLLPRLFGAFGDSSPSPVLAIWPPLEPAPTGSGTVPAPCGFGTAWSI